MLKYYEGKLQEAIYGVAIGDALGVPFEFQERDDFECTKMIGGGFHGQEYGTWSDDTSMTLATIKSLRDNNGEVVIDDIRNNFLAWVNKGEFTVDGKLFDIGHSTMKALSTGQPRMGEYENGNGSLMRILPLAFTNCSDDEIRAVSAITHGHEISTEACVIYVHVARRLLGGEGIDSIVCSLEYPAPFDRLSSLASMKRPEIRSSGYVVDTLEATLWSLVHKVQRSGGSYKEKGFCSDVLRAVNLGGDTDTVGAVTGGLAAIIYGLEECYQKGWLTDLRGQDVIRECLGME